MGVDTDTVALSDGTRLRLDADGRYSRVAVRVLAYRGSGVWATAETPEQQINVTAHGLGDHLLGLLAACGMQRETGKRTGYSLRYRDWAPWLECYDHRLTLLHGLSGEGDAAMFGELNCPQFYTHRNYPQQIAGLTLPNRMAYYTTVTGCGVWSPPCLLPRQPNNLILLAPHTDAGDRRWPWGHWYELEKLLQRKGYTTCVLDSKHRSQHAGLRGKKVIGADAATVTGLVQGARMLISNDSGLAHIAGLCKTPCVVLCGPIEGAKVHGCYENTKVIDGPLECTGCHLRGRYVEAMGNCRQQCSSLAAITPKQVAEEVPGNLAEAPRISSLPVTWVPQWMPGDSFPAWEGSSMAKETYRWKEQVARYTQVNSILEVGVRAGYSAAAFLAAGVTRLTGIDNDSAIDGGQPGAMAWARASLVHQFPAASVTLIRADSKDEMNWCRAEMIHVDGDHSYEGCLSDLRLAGKYAEKWVLVDDYDLIPDVRRAVNDWLAEGGWTWQYLPTPHGDMLCSRI